MNRSGATGNQRRLFTAGTDGVDMDIPVDELGSRTLFKGPIFTIEDKRIALARIDGGRTVIRRQLVHHAPCVVMLAHDTARDLYLVEREYRVGVGGYTFGLPAGFIDAGEDPKAAALRELREETGVVPGGPQAYRIEPVADCYSSEGMSDELVHIMVVRLDSWTQVQTRFDPDEHVQSAWLEWSALRTLPITASNAVIAVQSEALHRLAGVH
ncbi:NUDIX hydrolase [Bifidobacterium xylocopae]|uniref:NTP pyrophosphohydrolase n=1 Tax=Bifidobacterium xylocopae TaxID=2493119 RepID=A0A366KEG8_9BIFI|nr:NUDIX hydrolase [Bifidobacterium xylocopae]RBQ00091.1 NTP pyrophosphohydrolase [Bifidobacterium xylocopae]